MALSPDGTIRFHGRNLGLQREWVSSREFSLIRLVPRLRISLSNFLSLIGQKISGKYFFSGQFSSVLLHI